ncbi:MAG: SurA N-terminal domain-containing protein [Paracoccus sp. (in: a-proteobacteria)]|nr:SurA N-terminal domain-containing protein [Paracoccus sp. (in: a-proteobacteria)]
MSSLRTKGKSTIVWILMGLLLLGLGGFGVTNFAGGDSDIGRAGQTKISGNDYARTLSRQLQQMAMQTGQRMSVEEARAAGIVPAIQSRLVTSAVLEEDARVRGVSVGDARVAQVIAEMPGFQGAGGQFDRAGYADLLRREGYTERDFEHDVRMDEARMILQAAVAGGVIAPEAQAETMVGWMLEQRDISWMELTAAELPNPVAEPSEETLQAWHQANADRFTAPEIRRISYVWLTPELLAETVQLDEQALRDLYEAAGERYRLPERRMVSRLVFQSAESAAEARARLDAGQVTFEELAIERGLSLADTDMGEVTRAELGRAADPVFAATDNGIIGPVETSFGPAIFSLNAIFDPVEISFEDARADLRAEAAADRARRLIGDLSHEYEDLLAGGATLSQIADETQMQAGQIDYSADTPAEPGQISGYPSFRERAAQVQQGDFLRLYELEDGGIFALQLDEVVAPALIPFDEVRDEVAADWIESETRRQLLQLAEERKLAAMADELNGTGTAAEAAEETAVPEAAEATSRETAPEATSPETAEIPASETAADTNVTAAETTSPETAETATTETADATATEAPAPQTATEQATAEAAPEATTAEASLPDAGAAEAEPADSAAAEPAPPVLPGSTPPAAGQWATETGIGRGDYIEAAPQAMISEAFELEPGQVDIVDAEGRVLLVRLDAVHQAQPGEDNAGLIASTRARLTEALQGDMFDYYVRALQQKYGAELNPSAIAAIESRM